MAKDDKIWIIEMGDVMEAVEESPTDPAMEAAPRGRPAPRPSLHKAMTAPEPGAPPPANLRSSRQQARPAQRTAAVKHPTEQRPPVPSQPPSRAVKTSVRQAKAQPRRRPQSAAKRPPTPPSRGKAARENGADRTQLLSPGKLVLLTYLLGPLSILATRVGRSQRIWVGVAAVAVVSGAVLLLSEHGLLRGDAGGNLVPVWLLAAAFTTLCGSAVWARSLTLTGRTFRTARFSRLPSWCRKPWATGTLSVLLPGAGYFLVGHLRRAVATLALAGPVVLALLIVTHADRMWRYQQASGGGSFSSTNLEWVFLGAAVVLALGLVMWLVQVLDAVGTAAIARNLAAGGRRRFRSDWFAGALVATLVAAVFLFQPAQLATRLDGFASDLRQEGLQIIPLNLAEAALSLDPSQPRYAVQVAEICAELGWEDRADELRDQLDQRWHTYATLAGQAGSPAAPAAGEDTSDHN